MDKNGSTDAKRVSRHLSQLKVLSRLFEHELDTAQGESVALDRDLAESMLDTLEIFIEDLGGAESSGSSRSSGKESSRNKGSDKPQVTRLN